MTAAYTWGRCFREGCRSASRGFGPDPPAELGLPRLLRPVLSGAAVDYRLWTSVAVRQQPESGFHSSARGARRGTPVLRGASPKRGGEGACKISEHNSGLTASPPR